MRKIEDSNIDFEILISTQSQTSLDFLNPMFDGLDYRDYNILIINQNINSPDLISTYPTIRVINSKASGLAKSRNLAIQNCLGQICLFADDDVVYKHDFKQKIISSFESKPNAEIITFKMEDEYGNDFRKYPNIKFHTKKTVSSVNSVVIAFRKKSIQGVMAFDVKFGLNAEFPTGDEYVFLRNALNRNKAVCFEPEVILRHPSESSGQFAGRDKNIFARGAIFYKFHGTLSYFKLIHHIYLLKKKNMITISQMVYKFKIGLKGIFRYKQLYLKEVM